MVTWLIIQMRSLLYSGKIDGCRDRYYYSPYLGLLAGGRLGHIEDITGTDQVTTVVGLEEVVERDTLPVRNAPKSVALLDRDFTARRRGRGLGSVQKSGDGKRLGPPPPEVVFLLLIRLMRHSEGKTRQM